LISDNRYWAGFPFLPPRSNEAHAKGVDHPEAVRSVKPDDIRRAALNHVDTDGHIVVSLFAEAWPDEEENR